MPAQAKVAAPLVAKAASPEKKVAALRAVPTPAEPRAEKPRITEELLIEEVSIDGMCGVY